VRAGTLRHRIAVYSLPITQSSTGGDPPADPAARTLVCRAWASVQDHAARLPVGSFEGERTAPVDWSSLTHELRMRFVSGILSTMQVDFAGRTLDIVKAYDVDNRHRELVLVCLEKFTSATP